MSRTIRAATLSVIAAGILLGGFLRVDIAAGQALRRAPEIVSPIYFNAHGRGRLTMKSLRGQVVLVVFWAGNDVTFDRIAQSLNRWYQAYRPKGFQIVGVHAPVWDYQKSGGYVYGEIERLKLKFPVVVDNDGDMRIAFGHLASPAIYLVDRRGDLRAEYGCIIDLSSVDVMLQSLLEER